MAFRARIAASSTPGAFTTTALDNLGRDWRERWPFPTRFRGRVLGQHRQYLPNDFVLSAELGLISDFNFLEQYYEQEWDTLKDQSTGVELKRFVENSSWSLAADVRLNDFFTETEWLPRLDHFLFGQSLLFDRLTWHEHTQRRLRPAADRWRRRPTRRRWR